MIEVLFSMAILKNISKRFLKVVLYLILFVVVCLVGLTIYFVGCESKHIYSIDKVEQREYALVLGCGIVDNKPSHMLANRLDTALELYQNQKVKKLFLSGYKHGKFYDEVKVMKNYCLEHGVKESDIVEDKKGDDTFMSIQNFVRDIDSDVIIVTQKWHLIRALYIANHISNKHVAFGVKSNNTDFKWTTFKLNSREVLARIKALAEVIKYNHF